jgi:hypothetical protein
MTGSVILKAFHALAAAAAVLTFGILAVIAPNHAVALTVPAPPGILARLAS